MCNKELYRTICETEGDRIPLFLQYWWMQTVCQGKQWNVLLAYGKNPNQPIAAMPYLIGHRWGMRYVVQPQLTPYNGPTLLGPVDHLSDYQRITLEHQAYEQFIDQLSQLKLACFQQNFSPRVTNWLPFYWAGYSQTTRYTYRIEDLADPQAVLHRFHKEKRRKPIAKAQQVLHVVEAIDLEAFATMHQRYWHAKGQRDLLSEELMVRVMHAAISRHQGLLLGLADAENRLQIARFVVFDSQCAYALFSAQTEKPLVNGSSALLFWEMIQRLSPLTHSFDFEGSMEHGVEYSYRLYGASQTPYFQLSKIDHPVMRAVMAVRHAKHRRKGL